jgi:tellurite methyltransferase
MTIPASSVVRYSRFFSSNQINTVLDYGTGTLRNALYLVQQGFTVYAADLPEQVKALRSHPAVNQLAGLLKVGELKQSRLGVDLIVSTYVFNIIVRKSQRQRYLDNVVANLRAGGYLLIEVSCRRDLTLEHYFHCDDGLKTYTHHELDRLLAPYGFERICHYYSSHAVAILYQLAVETSVCQDAGSEEAAVWDNQQQTQPH